MSTLSIEETMTIIVAMAKGVRWAEGENAHRIQELEKEIAHLRAVSAHQTQELEKEIAYLRAELGRAQAESQKEGIRLSDGRFVSDGEPLPIDAFPASGAAE